MDCSWFTCEAAIFVAVPIGENIRHCTPTQARQFGAIQDMVAGLNLTRNWIVSPVVYQFKKNPTIIIIGYETKQEHT